MEWNLNDSIQHIKFHVDLMKWTKINFRVHSINYNAWHNRLRFVKHKWNVFYWRYNLIFNSMEWNPLWIYSNAFKYGLCSSLVRLMGFCLNAHIFFAVSREIMVRFCIGTTLRPRQNACQMQMTYSNSFSFKKIYCILIQMSPKFAKKCPIQNRLAMVQIMVWHRTWDKLECEPLILCEL